VSHLCPLCQAFADFPLAQAELGVVLANGSSSGLEHQIHNQV
jgi:hypothetical protein